MYLFMAAAVQQEAGKGMKGHAGGLGLGRNGQGETPSCHLASLHSGRVHGEGVVREVPKSLSIWKVARQGQQGARMAGA